MVNEKCYWKMDFFFFMSHKMWRMLVIGLRLKYLKVMYIISTYGLVLRNVDGVILWIDR